MGSNAQNFKGFRLLSVRPLEGCDSKFLKSLTPNYNYRFYNNYDFDFFNVFKLTRISVRKDDGIDSGLYSFHKKDGKLFNVNVSAVVGKNGTGKSSILDLFYAAIYLIAYQQEIIKDASESDYKELLGQVKIQFFYQINDEIFGVQLDGSSSDIVLVPQDKVQQREQTIDYFLDKNQRVDFKNFFYSIAINYSQYGLNSRFIGNWINSVFHKNDGYQTPLVINPRREEGNVDVNKESELAKQRLTALLLEPISKGIDLSTSLRRLAPNKIATRVVFKLNSEKLKKIEEHNKSHGINNVDTVSRVLIRKYSFPSSINGNAKQFGKLSAYVKSKLVKICSNYSNYERFIEGNEFVRIDELVKKLWRDDSHITFKLNQALNAIRFLSDYEWENDEVVTISINEFADEIEGRIYRSNEVLNYPRTIELIPPNIYDIDILFEDGSSFMDLSSGEKQQIFSLSNIVYHLININSVGLSKKFAGKVEIDNDIIRYNYVNILFDEVELYFHPDFQRKFISELLHYFKRIEPKLIEHINGVNIVFVTHSPFILSDIPNSNTLYLELIKGRSEQLNSNDNNGSFGANIHDLLANNFFLSGGFMGEFVKDKILSLVSFLEQMIDTGDSGGMEWTEDRSESFIKFIGEPLVKDKLTELHKQAFPEPLENLEIQRAIIDKEIKKRKGRK